MTSKSGSHQGRSENAATRISEPESALKTAHEARDSGHDSVISMGLIAFGFCATTMRVSFGPVEGYLSAVERIAWGEPRKRPTDRRLPEYCSCFGHAPNALS